MLKIINRDYTTLIIGQLISKFGNVFNGVAMMWVVYNVVKTGGKTGLIFGIAVLPGIIFMPFAGNLIDMFNRKKLLFWVDIISGINALILTMLAYWNALNFWNLLIILSVAGIASSLSSSTRSSLVQNLVKDTEYMKANSIQTFIWNVAQVALPTVGALLIANFNIALCFLLDALTFFIAAVFTLYIKSYSYTNKRKQSFFSKFVEGLQYIKTHHHYLYFILVFTAINFVIGAADMVVRILIDQQNMGVKFFGVFQTSFTVGCLIFSFFLSKKKSTATQVDQMERSSFTVSTVFIALAFLMFIFSAQKVFLLVGAVFAGGGLTWLNITFFAHMQRNIEKEFYGRVITLVFFISEITKPLSYSVFGYLTDHWSIRTIFTFDFACLLIILVIFPLILSNFSKVKETTTISPGL